MNTNTWQGAPDMAGKTFGWAASLVAALLALCGVLALLLAFHQVVSGAVQQGDARRQIRALQAEAAWRCRLAAGRIAGRAGLHTESDCDNPGVSR